MMLITVLVAQSQAALAVLRALFDEVRIPRNDIAALGVLVLIVLFAPSRAPSSLNSCVRDLPEPKEATQLESFLSAGPTHPRVAVRRTQSALHVRVFSGTIRFNRNTTQAHAVAMTTIVTTEQVQISHLDATLCVRAQGDRTSIAVLEGAVQVSALELTERPVASWRNGDMRRGILAMNLRSGDRAEIFRRGSDLEVRLETGTGSAAICSLTWDWGFAVLERRVA